MRFAAIARALLLGGLASLVGVPAAAQPQPDDLESEVRAVFLLRMAQFTDWPATPASTVSEPFEFCVVADEKFRSLLEAVIRTERVAGRPAVVRNLHQAGSPRGCELIYIPAALQESAIRILGRLPRQATLTVAGYEGFVRQGGAIELYRDGSHIRFRINRRAAESAGLALRSQLLRAAAAVVGD